MATKMTSSNHYEIFKKAIVEFGSPIKETMRLTAPDFNLKLLKVADDVKDVAIAYALELSLFDIAFKLSFINECDAADIADAPKDRNELLESIVELIDSCKPTSGDLKGVEFHVPLFYSFDLETASSSYFDDELRAKAHKIWITHLASIGISELEVLRCYKDNRSKYAALQPLKYQLEKIEIEIAKDNFKNNAIEVEASEVRYSKQSNLNSIVTGEVIDTTPKYFKTYRSLVDTVASLLSLGSTLSLLAGGIWLAFDGVWGGIGWGLVVAFIAPILLSLALLVGIIFGYPAHKMLSKGNFVFGYILVGMSATWTGVIMTLYFGYVIAEFLPYSKNTSLIAILLWGWGVATSSIQYIQQREIMSGGKSNVSFIVFSQIGFLVFLTLTADKYLTQIPAIFISIGIISFGLLLNTYVDARDFYKLPKVDAG